MTDAKNELARHYTCPKCRGRQCAARDTVLSKPGLLPLVPGKDNRYVEVTCSLCGYTEFYNRAIFVKSTASIKAGEKITLAENAESG